MGFARRNRRGRWGGGHCSQLQKTQGFGLSGWQLAERKRAPAPPPNGPQERRCKMFERDMDPPRRLGFPGGLPVGSLWFPGETSPKQAEIICL